MSMQEFLESPKSTQAVHDSESESDSETIVEEVENVKNRKYHYAFTLNNYTAAELTALEEIQDKYTYLIYGKEIGEQGTPHLQCHVYFKTSKTASAVLKIFHANGLKRIANLKPARDPAASIVYCQKDGQFREIGKKPKLQYKADKGVKAAASDYELACTQAKEGGPEAVTDAGIRLRYYSALQRMHESELNKKRMKTQIVELRPWQEELAKYVLLTPHPRKVRWYVDREGGAGKTEMARYLSAEHGACLLNHGKTADNAHKIPADGSVKIILFDFTRRVEEHVQYGFIEECKNGIIHSNKYNSMVKSFPVPHVIVFANWSPDLSALSKDRWDVIELS